RLWTAASGGWRPPIGQDKLLAALLPAQKRRLPIAGKIGDRKVTLRRTLKRPSAQRGYRYGSTGEFFSIRQSSYGMHSFAQIIPIELQAKPIANVATALVR